MTAFPSNQIAPQQSSTWLLRYARNVFSETGEDGIISKILQILPVNDRWCVEVGAGDGITSSNTRNLIVNKGYSAVLIEADKRKFHKPKKVYAQNPSVITINERIGWDAKSSLDTVLATTKIPCDFDFLSLDIDGNEYHVWRAMSKFAPKVVCVEFNPTIPTEVRFVQPTDPKINWGSSLLSLVELGKKKGYELVSVLPYNAFFVKSQYFPLFGIPDNSPQTLRVHMQYITYLFVGYDGTVFLKGHKRLPWHYMTLKESKVQHLPSFLRKYPPTYSKLELLLFVAFLLLTNPSSFRLAFNTYSTIKDCHTIRDAFRSLLA